jgi:hypothetical protein
MVIMHFLKTLFLGVAFFGLASSAAFAASSEATHEEDLNERDFEALRDYLNTKRTIDTKEKAENLSISGDVRTEWRHMNERQDGHNLRGGHATKRGVPISRNDFDIEFNLRFDYVCERAWGVMHLQFDNAAGIDPADCGCGDDFETLVKNHKIAVINPDNEGGSGECDDFCLKRAYLGYNVFTIGCNRFDVELGRRKLYDIFDSKAQFLSRFDGLLLKYSSEWKDVADWYVKLGGFLVDERVNHFAWATELGFLDIADTGIDFKYSFIDWVKNGHNRCWVRHALGTQFRVSQWTMYYHLNPDYFYNIPAKFYAAFLYNHAAKKTFLTHHKKKNIAWYAGVRVGEVDKEGDWAFEILYEMVQAQAVPDFDVAGLDTGNLEGNCFTAAVFIPTKDGGKLIYLRRGNTNFKGWRFEGLYALTDNLSLNPQFEWDTPEDKSIGGDHFFSKFELEVVYAF